MKDVRERLKKSYDDWAAGKKRSKENEEAFRKALAAWKEADAKQPDHKAFLESSRYDISVCTLSEPKKDIHSACVVRSRNGFPADKNFVYSGFGVNELDKEGVPQSHDLFTQTQGKAKLEQPVGEEHGLIRGRWKKGSKENSAAGKGDSGGFLGEQIVANGKSPRQMRLHGVLVAGDYMDERFNENEGDFEFVATPDTGGTLAVDLLADDIAKGFLQKPELLPAGAKINYCPQ